MAQLYEDHDFIDQHQGGKTGQPAERDPLFYQGAHQPGKYSRYQPGYSSHPRHPEKVAEQQPWVVASVGGYGHDEPRYHSDDELRRMVAESIQADPHLSSQEKQAVTVTVENGQVTLTGRVQSREAKDRLESLAYWAEGAGTVKSQIEVKD